MPDELPGPGPGVRVAGYLRGTMEGRGEMEKIITCRDVGMDCRFEARALTEDETLTQIMRHVREAHTRDWYELEEIHATARSLLHEVAV